MKFGAVLLVSSSVAQDAYDYGLDGAATNPVEYYGDYNYGYNYAEEGERLREKPNNDDLAALLANYDLGDSSYSYDYNNNYNTDYNDVLALINAAEASAGTTVSPPDYNFDVNSFYESYDGVSDDDDAMAAATIAADAGSAADADAGRPDSDGDSGVKLFENFATETQTDVLVSKLLAEEQTYCWSCHGRGANSAATLADCASNGKSVNCLDHGENDYCMVTLRQVNGEIKQLESGCAQRDTCDGIHNFYSSTKMDWMKDQCKPNDSNGNAYAQNARNRNRESVCSICHYTSKAYGSDPTTLNDDGSEKSKMKIDGSDVKILGSTAGKTMTITAGAFGMAWGQQANNVLDTIN